MNDYITTTKNQVQIAKIQNHVQDKPFHIAFTEWSPWTIDHMSTLAGALHFNLFLRHADAVKRANFTMFISLLGLNEEGETYKTPFTHMYKLFSVNVKGKSLDTYVESDTFNGEIYDQIPYLDVSSAYSEEDQTLVVNVVNRNMQEAIPARIISDTGEFSGDATVSVINAEEITERYSYEKRDKYSPEISNLAVSGTEFNYSFEPHSFTQIKMKIIP